MARIKNMLLPLLFTAMTLPLSAQEKPDTAYLFRFVAEKDMFFSPWSGNGKELDRLLAAISENRTAISERRMYLLVESYGVNGNARQTAAEVAKIRRNRVKSELILRGDVKEAHFVTDKSYSEPYGAERLRNVVIVTLPASAEKVAELADEEAATRVEAYNREMSGAANSDADAERLAAEQAKQAEAERLAKEQAEQERIAKEKAERQRIEERQRIAAEQAEQERLAAEAAAKAKPYTFAIRANLLRWATLTPDLGMEWRIDRNWGILVNGTWTSWSWDDKNRRYALWEVAPEVRYYIGMKKRGYIGAIYKVGQFNYKFSTVGKQGDLMGGGITGGYQLKLNRALSLDLNLGIGCIHADYDKYEVIDGVRVRKGNGSKNWWGPVSAGVTLMWNLF